VECIFEQCAPFGEGQENIYAVAWRCPAGHGSSLDVCPIGPLVPARSLCLNCGAPYLADTGDARCDACGLTRAACPAALGLTDAASADAVAAAQAAFARGLFRRGIAILNQALQTKIGLLEAWHMKARFLNSLGFNRTAAETIDRALPLVADASDRIALLEEESFLWAECERGEEALRCANAAGALGSNSIRTNYLRGRALGLLGQLEAARDQMHIVLGLDPDNADGRRALGMIEAAIRPTATKRWWQFWK
jgi:tetratricopeptide (TPR) repeat protein